MTVATRKRGRLMENFNSHAHVERDVKMIQCESQGKISTHTLTWSVTRKYLIFKLQKFHFNSHAHVERDVITRRCSRICIISTHTLTWSVTHFIVLDYDLKCISTHTLTWSVTDNI